MLNMLKKLKEEDYLSYVITATALGKIKAKQLLNDTLGKDIDMFYNTRDETAHKVILQALRKQLEEVDYNTRDMSKVRKVFATCGIKAVPLADTAPVKVWEGTTDDSTGKLIITETEKVMPEMDIEENTTSDVLKDKDYLAYEICANMLDVDELDILVKETLGESISKFYSIDTNDASLVLLDRLTELKKLSMSEDEYQRFINSISIFFPQWNFS